MIVCFEYEKHLFGSDGELNEMPKLARKHLGQVFKLLSNCCLHIKEELKILEISCEMVFLSQTSPSSHETQYLKLTDKVICIPHRWYMLVCALIALTKNILTVVPILIFPRSHLLIDSRTQHPRWDLNDRYSQELGDDELYATNSSSAIAFFKTRRY